MSVPVGAFASKSRRSPHQSLEAWQDGEGQLRDEVGGEDETTVAVDHKGLRQRCAAPAPGFERSSCSARCPVARGDHRSAGSGVAGDGCGSGAGGSGVAGGGCGSGGGPGSGCGSGAGPGSGSIGVAGSSGTGTVAGSSGAPGVPGSGTAGVTGASGTTGVTGSPGCGTSIGAMPYALPAQGADERVASISLPSATAPAAAPPTSASAGRTAPRARRRRAATAPSRQGRLPAPLRRGRRPRGDHTPRRGAPGLRLPGVLCDRTRPGAPIELSGRRLLGAAGGARRGSRSRPCFRTSALRGPRSRILLLASKWLPQPPPSSGTVHALPFSAMAPYCPRGGRICCVAACSSRCVGVAVNAPSCLASAAGAGNERQRRGTPVS
jgi:hypothetical protein